MPKYRVAMDVKLSMSFVVEAESEDAAEDKAKETYVDHLHYGVDREECDVWDVTEETADDEVDGDE